ncbi:MAG: hypothetical protein AAFY54_12845 [Cyanobacteria bacterium J06648_10]
MSLIIPTVLLAVAAAGVLASYASAMPTRELTDAENTLRAIAHRRGVSEPIPFAPPTSTVNAPGLVASMVPVHPLTKTPSPDALPRPASVENPLPQTPATVSETEELPIEMAEAANDREAEIIVTRWESGEAMTKTILNVWGVKAGGSTAYKNARTRYKSYLSSLEA